MRVASFILFSRDYHPLVPQKPSREGQRNARQAGLALVCEKCSAGNHKAGWRIVVGAGDG
jgi:hypothetical protein